MRVGILITAVLFLAAAGCTKGTCKEVCLTHHSGDIYNPPPIDDFGTLPEPPQPPSPHCSSIPDDCDGDARCACEQICGKWSCTEIDTCSFDCHSP